MSSGLGTILRSVKLIQFLTTSSTDFPCIESTLSWHQKGGVRYLDGAVMRAQKVVK